MNVYDFDGTILDGDTETYFFKYAFSNFKFSLKARFLYKKYTKLLKKHKVSHNYARDRQYCFLREIKDVDRVVFDFWNKHQCFIKKWYLDKQKEDDLIISATPKFLLKEIMKRLHINNLIAGDVDTKTGKMSIPFAYKDLKVTYYKEIYKELIPDEFYSDSDSDISFAKLAKKAYKVKGNQISEWIFE